MRRREMKLLLEERFERIALLETRIDTMDQLVEGYRAREQSVFDALQAGKDKAAKALQEAQAEGERIKAEAEAILKEAEQARHNARNEAEALLADAIAAAKELKLEAERSAIELTATVKADSERMLRDAEIIKREYEEMVDSFNAMLAQNASELETTAARFAEFVKDRKIDTTETQLDGNTFYKSVGALNDAALPDASENPALLMRNIYRIQNRPLPEDRAEAGMSENQMPSHSEQQDEADAQNFDTPLAALPEERIPDVWTDEATALENDKAIGNEEAAGNEETIGNEETVGNEDHLGEKEIFGEEESQPAETEPYSQAAWMSEAMRSESEPQAEFTKAFDDAFVKSDYTVHDDDCNVTKADAESAIDALLSGADCDTAAPMEEIPAATAHADGGLTVEPTDEAVRAFDAYYEETLEQIAGGAQDEARLDPAQMTPSAPQQEADAPEPYSAQAWAQDAFTSALEPQAEGTLFGEAEAQKMTIAQTDMDEKSISALDAEEEVDDYLTQIISNTAATSMATEPASAATAQHAATMPEPYSEQAWAKDAFTSALEPQAEGALFGETEAREERFAQTDADGVQARAGDMEQAFDAYLTEVNAYMPAAGSAAQSADQTSDQQAETAAEPYSEQAWAQEAFTSAIEPQAEGALFSMDATQEEPAPALRRYSDYGEIREWEPDPEPEMEELPTVSRYVGQSNQNEEISLDDLLEEIINSGE